MILNFSNTGRTGNQMFALAFSAILAARLGYKLDNRMARGEIPYDWFQNVKPETDGIETAAFDIEINDTVHSMDAAVHWCKGYRVSVRGFFERAEFYENHLDLLHHLFYQPEAKCGDSTIFHIRGTDFLTDGQFKDVPAKYYETAINLLGVPKVIVLTDDIPYAKYLLADTSVVAEYKTNDPKTDFLMMRSAKNLVISNSTFAWWAAWLSGANVIQPKRAGGDPAPTRNLIVPRWQQIEY